jgi:hypothetical protein
LLDVRSWRQSRCPTGVRDIDHDGRDELVVDDRTEPEATIAYAYRFQKGALVPKPRRVDLGRASAR